MINSIQHKDFIDYYKELQQEIESLKLQLKEKDNTIKQQKELIDNMIEKEGKPHYSIYSIK